MADGSETSRADPHSQNQRPAWVRFLLPSVGDLIFVVLLGLLVFTPLSVRLLRDAGIGWHIRTGQQILATHAIPRVDSFSSTMGGRPWFAWEWLYDVVVGELERAAGLNGVVWFTAVVIAAVFAGTFRLLILRGTGVLMALTLVLLAASASMIHFLARPHVVSWAFTLIWFWILDSSESEGDGWNQRAIWFLPVLMLVWVNVHGGFLIALALLGIYWVSAVWRWFVLGEDRFDDFLRRLGTGKRVRDLSTISVLSAAATLVNPYGWELHVHIYNYLSNRFLMDHIQEFQSPNFHGVAERCFAGLLFIALLALATRSRELRLSEGMVALLAVYSGLYASRNIPIASLLLVLVSGPLLAGAMERGAGPRPDGPARAALAIFFARMTAVESSLRGHLWPVVAAVATCAVAMTGGRLGSLQLMDGHFDSKRFPVAAVSYLERDEKREPVLSLDSWGGYLIYRLYPKRLVAVDDRHDFYGEEFFKSYLRMVQLQPGWDDFLREHRIRQVLLPRGSPLANMLEETAGWKMVYGDEVGVLFEKGPF
jgi:hypothetical protein